VKPGKDIPSLGNVGFGRLGEDPAIGTGGGARITAMANGGIVTSPTLALIGEAGPEAVVPLNRANGVGGVTINVNGGDPQAIVDALRRFYRQNGPLPVGVAY
jgi:phage-related minor tail protein